MKEKVDYRLPTVDEWIDNWKRNPYPSIVYELTSESSDDVTLILMHSSFVNKRPTYLRSVIRKINVENFNIGFRCMCEVKEET